MRIAYLFVLAVGCTDPDGTSPDSARVCRDDAKLDELAMLWDQYVNVPPPRPNETRFGFVAAVVPPRTAAHPSWTERSETALGLDAYDFNGSVAPLSATQVATLLLMDSNLSGYLGEREPNLMTFVRAVDDIDTFRAVAGFNFEGLIHAGYDRPDVFVAYSSTCSKAIAFGLLENGPCGTSPCED